MLGSKLSAVCLIATLGTPLVSAACTMSWTASKGQTCADLETLFGLSSDDFEALNPTADCSSSLVKGDSYCVAGTVDTTTTSTAATTSTTSTTSTKSTATSTGSSTFVTSTITSTSTSTSAPSPTQSGLVSTCNDFYLVEQGDGCYNIAASYGIALDDFYSWNPSVGDDCSGLLYDYYVCVSVPGATTTTAVATSTVSTATVTGPTPQQTGITSTCDSYYLVEQGDSCYDIAAEYGVALDDFYSWNPAVGDDCSGLLYGYYVCVGVPGTATATATTTATTTSASTGPSPTQTGIVSTCDEWYQAASGDSCWSIANSYGITLDEFYEWNPAVGSCSSLWADYYYCVGTS